MAEPKRVVSMNLCTDQLALRLAAPGQLVSVSHLALDPLMSAMVEQAAKLPINRGQAEQIFLLQPDLVLAGTYTSLAAVDLLRSLGIQVLQVPPVTSLAEGIAQVRQIGAALGQAAEAEALAARMEAQIAARRHDGPKATAALYFPNGYTVGQGTLSDDILTWTGWTNIAATAGVTGGGTLPLERLIIADPDLIITSERYPGASRAEDLLAHPALADLTARARQVTSDATWVCGTPEITQALDVLLAARNTLP